MCLPWDISRQVKTLEKKVKDFSIENMHVKIWKALFWKSKTWEESN